MKEILLFFVLLLSLSKTFAQSQALSLQQANARELDSLKREILMLKDDMLYVQANLSRCQKQYRTGSYFVYAGYAAMFMGVLTLYDSKLSAWYFSGGLLSTGIGQIIRIDAHKHIGRAGKLRHERKYLNYR